MTVAVALMAVAAQAQSYMVTPDYKMKSQIVNLDIRNMLELRDGGILANTLLFSEPYGDFCGCMLYKLEYDSVSAAITDSVFIEDYDHNSFLIERNPHGDDNIFARIDQNVDSCRSYLHVSYFDDDLDFKTEKEAWLPIADTLVSLFDNNYLLDYSGDVVLRYRISSRKEHHIVRIGLDGTEKAHSVIPYEDNPINDNVRIGLFNRYPKEYCIYGLHEPVTDDPDTQEGDSMCFMVLDSLLNTERFFAHNTPPNGYVFQYGWDDYENLLDTSFLLLTNCDTARATLVNDTIWDFWQGEWGSGIALSKCGKSDGKNHTAKIFHKQHPSSLQPIGVRKANDGSVYMSYLEYADGSCNIVASKLSRSLITLWESSLEKGDLYFSNIASLDRGGFAVGGLDIDYTAQAMSLFFVIFKDDSFSIAENRAVERHCTIYPNPTTGLVQITTDSPIRQIEMCNLLGSTVLEAANPRGSTIDVSALPAGVYIVRVVTADGKESFAKLVKK